MIELFKSLSGCEDAEDHAVDAVDDGVDLVGTGSNINIHRNKRWLLH